MSILEDYIYSTPAGQQFYECELIAEHCVNDRFHFEDGKKIICNHQWYIWNPSRIQSVILFSPTGKFLLWKDGSTYDNSRADIKGTWELKNGYGFGHLNDCLILKDEAGGVVLEKKIKSMSFDCIVLLGGKFKLQGEFGEYEQNSMTYLYVGHYTQTMSKMPNGRPITLHSDVLLETDDQLKQYIMHGEYVRLQCDYAKQILSLEKTDNILLFGIPSIGAAIAWIIFAVICTTEWDFEFGWLICLLVAGAAFGILFAPMYYISTKIIRKKEDQLFEECAKKMNFALRKPIL